MILIHFGETLAPDNSNAHPGRNPHGLLVECVRTAQWYDRAFGSHARSVYFLLPERMRGILEPVASELGRVSPVWHTEEGPYTLPKTDKSSDVWLVNGMQRPIVDWDAARSAALQRDCELLVFGSPTPPSDDRYGESLHVDEAGQVVCFRRHHTDSPSCVDSWSGPASLLVCPGTHAPPVVRQMIVHGWGLESIGALTRLACVGWSDRPGMWADARIARRRRWCPRPRERTPAGPLWLATQPGATPDDARPRCAGLSVSMHGPATAEARGGRRGDRAYRLIKRTVDVMCASAALVVLCPVMLVVACLIKMGSRGPALFGHTRQGLGGREFLCLKYRTMVDGADALQADLRKDNEVDGPQFKIAKDPRLTGLGGWLRRYNVDELPQLINVLRGDMSLVGPRPSPDGENQFCPGWRRARLSVRPGITGLWQLLRLRDTPDADFEEWIYYDVEYVRHRSLWLDCQILLYTPLAIFAPRRLTRFAERLERRGICVHSPRTTRTRVSRPSAATSAVNPGGHAAGSDAPGPTPRPALR